MKCCCAEHAQTPPSAGGYCPSCSIHHHRSSECGEVLRLKDWPDAVCRKPAGHPLPHDGETGTAVVKWGLR